MWLKEKDGVIVKTSYSMKDLKKDFPNTSFPSKLDEETLSSFGVKVVKVDQTVPDFDEDTQEIFMGDPVKNNKGEYVRAYEVREYPKETKDKKKAEKALKTSRNVNEKLDEVLREVLVKYVLANKAVPKEYLDYVSSLDAIKESKVSASALPTKPEKIK